MRISTLLEQVVSDLRYALRVMASDRLLTALVVLTLALGTGANTGIFSVINTLMLRPLAVANPGELVEIASRFPGEPKMYGFGWKDYEHYRDSNHVFSDLLGTTASRFNVGEPSNPETVDGAYVTSNFFSALGLRPAAGRLIGPEDDRAAAPVAVISDAYWKDRFHGDPAIIGRTMTVGGVPVTVIGVAPREFFGLVVGLKPRIWVPASSAVALEPAGAPNSPPPLERLRLALIGRLRTGASIGQARAEMAVLDRVRVDGLASGSADPLTRQIRLELQPGGTGLSPLREHLSQTLIVLMVSVDLILLLACINVATMLLARGASRRREMALRVSLGAGRLRLARQVLTESMLLAAFSSVLGGIFALVGADALLRILTSGIRFPGALQFQVAIRPDARVVLFTAAVALGIGLLFGAAPAWSAIRSSPMMLLRHKSEPMEWRLVGKGLVVVQVVLSLVLLSGAGLFVGYLSNLRNVSLGFDRQSVLLTDLNPAGSGYNRDQLTVLYRDLLQRIESIQGVRAATLSAITPLSGAGWSRFITVEGFRENPDDRRYLAINAVGPRYFETYRTPLLAGREFQFDDQARARVAIVNRAMSRYYFGDASPIGRRFRIEGDDRPYEIVGLVDNAKYGEVHDMPPRSIYLNAFQDGRIASLFAIRTDRAPLSVASAVQEVIHDVVPRVKVAKVTTLAAHVDESVVQERVLAAVSGLFGVLGGLLAAIGLYGLLAYTVARRVHEIGIRMALGATRRDVVAMVVKSALVLVAAGVGVGVPVALLGTRVAVSRMQGLAVSGRLPIALAVVLMIGVALLAALFPARRASRIEPSEALRME